MNNNNIKYIFLVVDDDFDEVEIIKNILLEEHNIKIHHLANGKELIEYLIDNIKKSVFILLDIKMPKKDGLKTLKEIRKNFKTTFPIIIFTNSGSKEDIEKSYKLGASSYIIKPYTEKELKNTINNIVNYWFKTVILP